MRKMHERDYVRPPEYRIVKFFTSQGDRIMTPVGWASSLQAAKEKIQDDRKAMLETFGGLMAPTPQPDAVYRIFRADWEQVGEAVN